MNEKIETEIKNAIEKIVMKHDKNLNFASRCFYDETHKVEYKINSALFDISIKINKEMWEWQKFSSSYIVDKSLLSRCTKIELKKVSLEVAKETLRKLEEEDWKQQRNKFWYDLLDIFKKHFAKRKSKEI